MSRFRLSRRAVLRAAGVSVGLPVLEAMLDGKGRWYGSAAAQAMPPAVRLVTFFIPNGVFPQEFWPASPGPNPVLPTALAPLADARFAVQGDVTIVGNLINRADGMGPGGGHAQGTASFGNGMPVTMAGAGGPTVDQWAAQRLGVAQKTMAMCPQSPSTFADGLTTAHMNHASWEAPGRPTPSLRSPRTVFNQLFGGGGAGGPDADRTKAKRLGVLHYVQGRVARLNQRLGVEDRRRLDEYLTGVNALEARINATVSCSAPTLPPDPAEVPARTQLMLDLLVLGLQCGALRTANFMLAPGSDFQNFPWLQLSNQHHAYAHAESEDGFLGVDMTVAKAARRVIVPWEIEQFAYLLRKMKDVFEGAGSLLDHSVVYLGSEHASGGHGNSGMPVLLAGRANGQLRPGQYVTYAQNRSINDLHLLLLHLMGLNETQFGVDSQGPLPGLT